MNLEPGVRSPKPVLIYDGDCGFCRYWLARWRQRLGDRLEYIAFQDPEVAARFPHLSRDHLEHAVHLVEVDGTVHQGARAVFEVLALGSSRFPIRAYQHVPGVAAVTEFVYGFIASHRPFAARVTTLLWGRSTRPSTYAVSNWIFLRLLGAAYFAAFLSLSTQVIALVGHNGILPADAYMTAARQWADTNQLGIGRVMLMPTVLWWTASDVALNGLCIGGAVLALLLIAGAVPVLVLPLLWVFYLSLCVVCRDFLEFQWDLLLLETGLLAILVAPLTWWDRLGNAADPPRVSRWLLWWLLFRLTLASGIVKLASGDPTWRGLTALVFHYETQPLPTPLAYYMHQLPVWFHKASTAFVLGVELVTPWFILTPRRLRALAAFVMIALQVLIAVTGNYAFFNLLTIALCVLLLDDEFLRRFLHVGPVLLDGPPRHARTWPTWAPITAAIIILPVSSGILLSQMGITPPGAMLVSPVAALISPFRSVNGYGLFAVMTQTRDEIVIEGSRDQITWLPYEFKNKPGDPRRPPSWVAPHQPRLDWQMWFAALDQYDNQVWLKSFLIRLLQGSPDTTPLLSTDPFDGTPPMFVRCRIYRYRFSEWTIRQTQGLVWTRDLLGDYSPILTLKSQREVTER